MGTLSCVEWLGGCSCGSAGAARTGHRHCERSEAIHRAAQESLDCFAALAMMGSGSSNFAHRDPSRQRESGPVGGEGRGTDDDRTPDDCALGCWGLGCGMEAACGAGDGAVNDIFCLMSSPTACSAAMFWAICSCLKASCSTLRRTVSRLDARGSSCCAGPGEVAATTGDFVAGVDNNQASIGARATTISFAASP